MRSALLKNRHIPMLQTVMVFFCMFVVGVLLYRDYGVSVDEQIQRQHSLVSYKYIMEQVFHRNIAQLVDTPALQEYQHRYYGTFLQLPMVFLEDLNNFQTDLGDVMRMRHLITFVYCYLGYVCFYWMGKKIFRHNWIALLGALMLYLYPRFFATQFFYLKDTLFAATIMAAMWATVLFLENGERPLYGLLFCVVTAICANLRFIGMMIPGFVIGYLLLRDLFVRRVYRDGPKAVLKRIGVYAVLVAGFLAVYIAISPACWVSPLKSVARTILHFSYYDTWKRTSIFMGREVPWNAVPWYFIPVWMLISLPIWYNLLFTGALFLIVLLFIMPARIAKRLDLPSESNAQTTYLGTLLQAHFRYVLFALALFLCPLLLVIIRQSVLYSDWRQMYFLLVPFVIIVQFGVFALIKVIRHSWVKSAIALVISCALLFQVGWIVKNHPHEHQFLNRLAAPYGDLFWRDASRTSLYPALSYLVEHAEEEIIVLDSAYSDFKAVSVQVSLLTPEQQDRIRFEPGGQYQIESYRYIIGNDASHDGYEEWYTIKVDGYKIASVFRAVVHTVS
jgi:hypothetical protein